MNFTTVQFSAWSKVASASEVGNRNYASIEVGRVLISAGRCVSGTDLADRLSDFVLIFHHRRNGDQQPGDIDDASAKKRQLNPPK